MIIFSFILSLFANHLPVMYVQVPQWADDWAVCAVDIPDAKCHWYVMSPDNTFGVGILIGKLRLGLMQMDLVMLHRCRKTVLEKLQDK